MKVFLRTVVVFGAVGLGLALTATLLPLEWPRPGLAETVLDESEPLGVDQPVTAVLLLFRGYDTWLELVVLLVAAIGVVSLHGPQPLARRRIGVPSEDLLTAFTQLLFPWILLVAGYLVWLGTKESGGAFQAGVVAAAGLVLMYFANRRVLRLFGGWRLRWALVAAVGAPVLLAFWNLATGQPMLTYPAAGLAAWLLAIELAYAFGITLDLTALVMAAEPARDRERGG